MVLVDPSIRRAGVGTALLNKAIEDCEGKGVAALDATPEGRKLYLNLGFSDYCHLSRMVVDSCADMLIKSSVACEPMKATHLKKVIAYDEKIFGAQRGEVIKHLYEHNKRYAYVFKQGAKICGYCLGRGGHNYEQIGPIVADDLEIAQSLLMSSLRMSRKKSVLIDCVNDQDDFYQLLESLGFTLQRPFIRMFKGKAPKGISMQEQYAISGPELG